MQNIEPYYNWRHIYTSEEDEHSPFHGVVHSEFAYEKTIYNFYIHPQWDDFGSKTLYCKILYTDYDLQVAIIELIGEWNDAIENDIMTLKYELTDELLSKGIIYFVLIGENVLNFHSGEKDYYEAIFEELNEEGGWMVILNLSKVAQYDFVKEKLNRYIELIEVPDWRVFKPHHLFRKVKDLLEKRIGL